MGIQEYLDEQQIPFQKILHPPAYSAQRRAKYLRFSGSRVARAVLLAGPEGFFVAILLATRQVDLARLSRYWGGPVRLATLNEITQVFRDCEWGAISPFGNRYGLPTLVDPSVPPDSWIVVEGGSHHEAVMLHCADFERLSGSFRVPLALP